MIEVEKKFKPSTEQLNAMIADAEFLGEKVLHDVYYDYPDNRLFRGFIKFRSRNGVFELKISRRELADKDIGVEKETEDAEEVKKYFNTKKDLQTFVNEEMYVFSNYKNTRKKYKNGEFHIDVDKLDFGHNVVEIEIMVEKIEDVKNAKESIVNFAKKYNFDLGEVPSKGEKYFEIVEPGRYKELYGDK